MQIMVECSVSGAALRKRCQMDCRQLGIIWMCKKTTFTIHIKLEQFFKNYNLKQYTDNLEKSTLSSVKGIQVKFNSQYVHSSKINFELWNRFATSIDTLLEDEEQFADQLKEYYSFGDSLR